MAGTEFSAVWVTTLLQRDVAGAEEATITITEVAEDDRAGEDKVKNSQADKLLKVECSEDVFGAKPLLLSDRERSAHHMNLQNDGQKELQQAPQLLGKNPSNVTGK